LPIIDLDEIPQTESCPLDSQRNDILESCTCLPCAEVPTCNQVLVEVIPGMGNLAAVVPTTNAATRSPFAMVPMSRTFPISAPSANPAIPMPFAASNSVTCPWRCTLDGERDCQATECPLVDCDRPIRKEGECCQTCPDEASAPPPHISILQPYSGATKGPETAIVSSTSSAEGFPLIPDLQAPFSTVYSDFYELASSTTDAEVSSDAAENIASSEAPLQENNSSTRDLEASTDSSSDSSMVSSTDQSTTNGPASTSEASASSVSDLPAWTSQSPAETTRTEQKSTDEPEVQTPESTSQVKAASEEKVTRDARNNNTEHRPYVSQDILDIDSKNLFPVKAVILVAVSALLFGCVLYWFVYCLIWKRCRVGKKVNGNYHEVSTQQPQEVCNLKSFESKVTFRDEKKH
ncbi:endochitinase A-like, partial [Drosophila serrata]|uniref:endochitinase A-like n=1 Tax=Drosophila serrata TaxID=7274 RepID=UPI000A1D21C1